MIDPCTADELKIGELDVAVLFRKGVRNEESLFRDIDACQVLLGSHHDKAHNVLHVMLITLAFRSDCLK